MTDKREAILVRLLAIAGGLNGIAYAARNDINIAEEQLPAAIVLDGEEEVDDDHLRHNVPALAPMRVHMTPLVSLWVSERTPDVGSALNALRAALIRAVLFDGQLAALAGEGGGRSSGAVRYLGCAPGLIEGRAVIGNMIPRFRISYVLDPSEL
jgi:hypothetical protein